jgi:hypothetical protein
MVDMTALSHTYNHCAGAASPKNPQAPQNGSEQTPLNHCAIDDKRAQLPISLEVSIQEREDESCSNDRRY